MTNKTSNEILDKFWRAMAEGRGFKIIILILAIISGIILLPSTRYDVILIVPIGILLMGFGFGALIIFLLSPILNLLLKFGHVGNLIMNYTYYAILFISSVIFYIYSIKTYLKIISTYKKKGIILKKLIIILLILIILGMSGCVIGMYQINNMWT